MKIFVYGTLKSDGMFHSSIKHHVVNVERGYIKGFQLFNLGTFPGIHHTGDQEDIVYGEILTLNPKTKDKGLMHFDMIEGIKARHPMYTREQICARQMNGDGTSAYAYVMTPEMLDPKYARLLESGAWTNEPL